MRLFFAAAALVLTACPDRIKKIDPMADAGCGDGFINAQLGEECEGSDLNGATCQSLGFDEGSLTCSECKLVKTLCVKRCGNGMIDPGEGCDGDAGLPGCADFGYVSCTDTCQVNRAHCVTSPFQAANAALTRSPGGPTTLGDLPRGGLGDLIMVVPTRFRVEAFPYTVQQGFNATDVLIASFGQDPVQAIAVGDDLVALNRDGTLDRYAYGSTYTRQPFPDAGCSGVLIGALGDAGVATSSCDAGELLVWGGGVTRAATNGGVCSIADFDRDGRPDVLSLAGTQLDVHAAPSFAASDAGQLPVALTSLVAADLDGDGDLDLAGIAGGTSVKLIENLGAAGFADHTTIPAAGAHDLRAADLDLDGRPDLVWESGDHAEVRRNQGSWVFAPYTAVFGSTAAPLSFSVGDVDEDGDLDLVSTRSGGGDVSVSYIQLNKVR